MQRMALLVAVLSALVASAHADEYVAIRIAPNSNTALIETIAGWGRVVDYAFEADENVYDVIREFCGNVSPAYWRTFREANRLYADVFASGIATRPFLAHLPRCAYWQESTKSNPLTAVLTSDLETLAYQQLGVFGPQTLAAISSMNRIGSTLTMASGKVLRLPYVTRTVTFSVKGTAEDFARALFLSAGVANFPGLEQACNPGIDNRAAWYPIISVCPYRFDLQFSLPANGSGLSDCDLPVEGAAPTRDDVIRAMETVAAQLPAGSRPPARVVVADLGLPGFRLGSPPEGRYPDTGVFARAIFDWQPPPASPHLGDEVPIGGRLVMGRTMTALTSGKYELAPAPAFLNLIPEGRSHPEKLGHGAHVLGIVAGGALTGGDYASFAPYYQMRIVNLVNPNDASIPLMTTSEIDGAIDYATNVGAQVINFSLESADPIPAILNRLASSRMLVVAAAGNGSIEINNPNPVFPAFYGGKRGGLSSRLISVAAHNVDGRLASFSDWSAGYVDIAAPGCQVESVTDIQGSRHRFDGTSQAAPFVTMVAALLWHLQVGLRDDKDQAATIKRRILSAADVDASLYEGKLFARGRLNIIKSLRFDADIVETTDRNGHKTLAFGELIDAAQPEPCADNVASSFTLTKIVPNYRPAQSPGTPATSLVMYAGWDGLFEVAECPAKDFVIRFRDRETNAEREILSSDISDIVLRRFFWPY